LGSSTFLDPPLGLPLPFLAVGSVKLLRFIKALKYTQWKIYVGRRGQNILIFNKKNIFFKVAIFSLLLITLCESPEIYQVKIGLQFFDMWC
jgi:hypothetical protein